MKSRGEPSGRNRFRAIFAHDAGIGFNAMPSEHSAGLYRSIVRLSAAGHAFLYINTCQRSLRDQRRIIRLEPNNRALAASRSSSFFERPLLQRIVFRCEIITLHHQ